MKRCRFGVRWGGRGRKALLQAWDFGDGLCGLANVPDGAGMGGLSGGFVALFVRFLLGIGLFVRKEALSCTGNFVFFFRNICLGKRNVRLPVRKMNLP